jgi:hypothetical protein
LGQSTERPPETEAEPETPPPPTPTPPDDFPFGLLPEIENENKYHSVIPQKGEEEVGGASSSTQEQSTPENEHERSGSEESLPSSTHSYISKEREKEFTFKEPILLQSPPSSAGTDDYTRFKNVLIDEIMSRIRASALDGTTHHIVTILPPTKLLAKNDLVRTTRSNADGVRERNKNRLRTILKSLVRTFMEK